MPAICFSKISHILYLVDQSICTCLKIQFDLPFSSGSPGGSAGKESACNEGDLGSIPGSGRSLGEGNGNPTPVFLPGKSHGWTSLVGYSPWGHKESDTTERLHFRGNWAFKDISRILYCNVAIWPQVGNYSVFLGFPGVSDGKESACNEGDLGLIPELGRYPGEGNGYPLQYSGLQNSMDCIVHGSQRVEHNWATFTSLWASSWGGFSCWGTQALRCTGFSSCTWAQYLGLVGSRV